MKIDSLKALYVHQLKDLYSAENQILEALPKIAEAAADPKLQAAFQAHLQQTRGQVRRIEQIFRGLDCAPGGHRCKGMEGLIAEGQSLMEDTTDPQVLDAGLIASAQRVEHYEIAGYGTARAYAEQLGEYEAADLLRQSLEEEGETDRTLSALAGRSVNFQAMEV